MSNLKQSQTYFEIICELQQLFRVLKPSHMIFLINNINLLCARHYSKQFICINIFRSHISWVLMSRPLIESSVYHLAVWRGN